MSNTARCLTIGFALAWPGMVRGQGCPPPAARPFFEFQVERLAAFIPDSTLRVQPAAVQRRTPTQRLTLVSFVVDTLGRPDTVTYKVIREVESGLGAEGRAVVARWRYQPAQIRGCVVAQLVQTPIERVVR